MFSPRDISRPRCLQGHIDHIAYHVNGKDVTASVLRVAFGEPKASERPRGDGV